MVRNKPYHWHEDIEDEEKIGQRRLKRERVARSWRPGERVAWARDEARVWNGWERHVRSHRLQLVDNVNKSLLECNHRRLPEVPTLVPKPGRND